MPTIISGKHFKLSPSIKDYVTRKLRKLEKHSVDIINAKAELDRDANQQKGMVNRVELSISVPGKMIKAGQKAEHMREAIDLCFPKIERQLKRYESKRKDVRRRKVAKAKRA